MLTFLKRHPFICSGIFIVLLLLFAAASLLWQFYSNADLLWAKDYAKQHGVPTTQQELPKQHISPKLLEQLRKFSRNQDSEYAYSTFMDSQTFSELENSNFDSDAFIYEHGEPGAVIHDEHKRYYSSSIIRYNIEKIIILTNKILNEQPRLYFSNDESLDPSYEILSILFDYALTLEHEQQAPIVKLILKLGLIDRDSYWTSLVALNYAQKLICNSHIIDEESIGLLKKTDLVIREKFTLDTQSFLIALFEEEFLLREMYHRENPIENADRCFIFLQSRKKMLKAMVDICRYSGTLEDLPDYCDTQRLDDRLLVDHYETTFWDEMIYNAHLTLHHLYLSQIIIASAQNKPWPKSTLKYFEIAEQDGYVIGVNGKHQSSRFGDSTYYIHGHLDENGKAYFARKIPVDSIRYE